MKKETQHLTLSLPIEIIDLIRDRAERNERSVPKEVVWIIRQYLKATGEYSTPASQHEPLDV